MDSNKKAEAKGRDWDAIAGNATLIGELRDKAALAHHRRQKVHHDIVASPSWLPTIGRNLRRLFPDRLDLVPDPFGISGGVEKSTPLELNPRDLAQLAATLRLGSEGNRKTWKSPECFIPDAIGLTIFAAAMVKHMGLALWGAWAQAEGMSLQEAMDATDLSERTIRKWIVTICPEFLESDDWKLRKTQTSIPVELVVEIHQQAQAKRNARAKTARKKQLEAVQQDTKKYASPH